MVETIRTLYEEHIHRTEQFFASQSVGESIGRLFMGRGAYSGTGLFLPFLETLEKTIGQAAEQSVTASDAAEIVRYMLIEELVPKDHPVRMELEAAEQKADPLIPLLEKTAAEKLAGEYEARHKKRFMMPSQRKTLKALEKAAK